MGEYENFEALKKDWESKEWGYTSKVTVTVVESYTATQIEELKAIPDLFPDMPKTEPVEITLENAEDFVECEEFEVICFKELTYRVEMFNTPYSESHTEYFCGWFAYDCRKGGVYSKDFQWVDCPCCQRTICEQNPSNGWMVQFRHINIADADYDDENYVCSECFETTVMREGIDLETVIEKNSLVGSWFTDGELEEYGYVKVEGMQELTIGSGRFSYKDPQLFFDLLKSRKNAGEFENHTVLFQYDSMAIGGLGGAISVWKRQVTYYRVFDKQTGTHFATGYNEKHLEDVVEHFKSYILMGGDDDFDITFIKEWDDVVDYLQEVVLEEDIKPFAELDNYEEC